MSISNPSKTLAIQPEASACAVPHPSWIWTASWPSSGLMMQAGDCFDGRMCTGHKLQLLPGSCKGLDRFCKASTNLSSIVHDSEVTPDAERYSPTLQRNIMTLCISPLEMQQDLCEGHLPFMPERCCMFKSQHLVTTPGANTILTGEKQRRWRHL